MEQFYTYLCILQLQDMNTFGFLPLLHTATDFLNFWCLSIWLLSLLIGQIYLFSSFVVIVSPFLSHIRDFDTKHRLQLFLYETHRAVIIIIVMKLKNVIFFVKKTKILSEAFLNSSSYTFRYLFFILFTLLFTVFFYNYVQICIEVQCIH